MKPGDSIKIHRFGRHQARTLVGTITKVTARSVIVDRGGDRIWKFRLRDGYECGYSGDRSGYRIDISEGAG